MSHSKVYIITGASRGLGEAFAAQLMTPDNWLLCVSRTRNEALVRQAQSAGVRLDWFECDLAGLSADGAADSLLNRMFGGAVPEVSRIRLINNAGVIDPIGPAHDCKAGDAAHNIAINLTAPMALTAAFLRATQALPADKRVMQISSGAGRHPYAGWSAYCAAKAGLDHFTRCVKLEQDALPHGAKVASVAPGVLDTEMQAQIRKSNADRFPSHSRFVQMYEKGSLVPPRKAAERLLEFLEHPEFGNEPVVDIRDWNTE